MENGNVSAKWEKMTCPRRDEMLRVVQRHLRAEVEKERLDCSGF